MSSEWETASLLDYYDVRSGLSKPAKDFGSGFPFLTFKDVFYNYFAPEQLGDLVQSTESDRAACSVRRGDVFLTRTSETMHELGMSCVALKNYQDATFNGFCKRLRPKPECRLVPEYVGYYLRSPEFRQAMLAMSTMSTRASLNNEMIGRLKIAFPPQDIQVQIAAVLKVLDDRITLLRKTNATLESIAQAIFKSWFVDFDPVRAKQEDRAPEGMDEATATLFPDSFGESELGAVPKGWSWGDLTNFATFQNGYAFKTKDWQDEGNPVVKIGNVKPSIIDIKGASYVSADVLKGLERFMLSRGDLLVGMTGYVGETGLVPEIFPPAYINQRVGRISTSSGVLDLGFVCCLVRNSAFKTYAEAKSHGSAQANVSGSDLMSYPCIIPSPDVLSLFNKTLNPIIDSILSNYEQAQTLTALRDTLLPRLISGQLRLPEVESVIEDVY